jgi:hypothetical protein
MTTAFRPSALRRYEMSESPPVPDRENALPGKVSDAAAQAELGKLVVTQQGSHPVGNLVFGLVVAGVLVASGFLLSWLTGIVELRVVAFLAFVCFVLALIVFAMSLAALASGFTATYLYERGLVHTKNVRLKTVAFSDVDELLLWRAGGKTALAGTLLAYYVVTRDGQKIAVEAKSKSGEDSLGLRLQEIVREHGRPVVESGPYVGRLRP